MLAGILDEKENDMSHPVIDADECIGCGICVDACPQEVLEVVGGKADCIGSPSPRICGSRCGGFCFFGIYLQRCLVRA